MCIRFIQFSLFVSCTSADKLWAPVPHTKTKQNKTKKLLISTCVRKHLICVIAERVRKADNLTAICEPIV
jgi:hypothetical protein